MLIAFLIATNLFSGEGIPAHFKPLSPLVGQDWVAEFPGGNAVDIQRWEWIYEGKFLKNTHWVKDPSGKVVYEGETYYAWDHSKARIAWFYFNSTGGHIVGHLEHAGETFIAWGVNHGPGSQTPRVKGAVVLKDGSWDSVHFFLKDGRWVEQMSVTYKPLIP